MEHLDDICAKWKVCPFPNKCYWGFTVCARSLTHSLTHSLAHSLTRSLARSLTHSLTHIGEIDFPSDT